MRKMKVLAVVPTVYSADVSRALAFEGADFSVLTSSEDAIRTADPARKERPDLIIGPGSLLSWVHGEPSLKGVPFVALDETGILSEDVAMHAGAVELISLYEMPRENAVVWWNDTVHRLVTQYKPAHTHTERITLARAMTPEERADHVLSGIGASTVERPLRTALVRVFTEIDQLRDRIDQLECRFNNFERV